MSPEKEYMSAYLDGEMPHPWKNRFDRLLSENEECRDTLERHRAVHEACKSAPEPDFRGPTERSWLAVCSRIAEDEGRDVTEVMYELSDKVHVRGRSRVPVWRRRISVPLPLAAAAVVVVFLGAFLLVHVVSGSRIDASQAAVAQTMGGLKVTANVKDVEQLLDILNGQNKVRELKIELPVRQQFKMIGQPLLLRATDGLGSLR